MRDFESPTYYINRELSWLSFNERVLEEAMDSSNPLMERLKFLSITASNLDEFFMIRVANLMEQVKAGITEVDNKSHLTPKEQLVEISRRTHAGVLQVYQILMGELLPLLAKSGFVFVSADKLSEEQMEFVKQYYEDRIYPVLTPMAIDASRPFPLLLNKSVNLAVYLTRENGDETQPLLAVVQVPSVLPRYVELPSDDGNLMLILLEEIISLHVGSLFQGNKILSTCAFRITRNVDLNLDEEGIEDLLEEIEKELKKRKMGSAVRLEIASSAEPTLLEELKDWLELEDSNVYLIKGPLDLGFLQSIYSTYDFESLKFPELKPQTPRDLTDEDYIFETLSEKDVLLHHPYESFDPVVNLILQAAEDPQVLAIKQTLYRVSGDSTVVHALARAAENGKQVTVLVELKARFDEANNILWAKKLEQAGCHVIYGLVGLKTHAKILLIVRSEAEGLTRYVHLSTGNYNDATARFYTDIGMLTAREDFGIDASALFNHLSGYASVPEWNVFSTAPSGLRSRIIELIENEISCSTTEKPGHIIAKMNSLTDKEIIKALFRASCAGVQVDLIIRGICCLRPGVPGISENIRIISIVGRFLEHSRIFYFQNGRENAIYLSSADWMTRNMASRVEILFPVLQKDLKERVKNILELLLVDNVKARLLGQDGNYRSLCSANNVPLDTQMYLHQEASHMASSKGLHSFYQ